MSAIDVRVVGIAGDQVDYPAIIAEQFRNAGLRCSLHDIRASRVWDSRLSLLREVRGALRETPAGAVSIYCSGLTELYVEEADLSLHFSAYRRWFDPERMRVLPHLWDTRAPPNEDEYLWRRKPPLTVGFMGTGYVDSRAGKVMSSLPMPVKLGILSGEHLRFAGMVAALYTFGVPVRFAMTFPRGETLRMVERTAASSGAEAHIIDTGGFTRSAEQVQDYVGHMREVTYVLCPRGIENFSFRFFEALKFGRVPVLIDTDVVLPEGTNWDELMVRVPYSRLPEISEIVAEDHRNRTAADFIARQQLGLRTISDLEGGSWVGGLIDDVRRRLAAKSSRNNAKVLDS